MLKVVYYSTKSVDLGIANPTITPAKNRNLKEKIGMEELAEVMKPYATTHGELLISLIDMLDLHEKDSFTFELAKGSSEEELLQFDPQLLHKMSVSLNSWTIWYNAGNAQQQLRVDSAIEAQKIALEIKAIRQAHA